MDNSDKIDKLDKAGKPNESSKSNKSAKSSIILDKINKSANDSREYYYTVLDNKLKVIIIEDEDSTMCSALLNVNVGSIHETIDGLAHFLEHMVFMGSRKYPDESDFMDFVKKHGGVTNAMTSDTDTTYYFTINDKKFTNVLDMFAWFFIDPLLKTDGIDREVSAVDSESKKNLLDDGWIFHEILKKTMSDSHPINHYTCGDKDTLVGDNLREQVKSFFDEYYSSNLMNLIIFKNKNIDTSILLDQINDTFGKIHNKNVVIDKNYGNIINPCNLVKYIPNKTNEVVNICVQVPTYKNYSKSPIHLINHILLSKVENSLFKYYEQEGIVLNFDFNELYSYDDFSIYSFELILKEKTNDDVYTDEEISHITKIFFDYIKSIDKCDYLDSIYDKLQIKNNRSFAIPAYPDKIDAMFYLNDKLLKNIDPVHLLDYMTYPEEYKNIKTCVSDFLHNIIPSNSSVIYGSSKFKFSNPLKVHKFDTPYIMSHMISHTLTTTKYNIILPNKFMSDKITILKGDDDCPSRKPFKLDEKKYTLIHNFNSSFNTPHVHTYISIESLNFIENVDVYTKCILFIDTIYSNSDSILSELRSAGYNIIIKLEMDTLFIYMNSDNNNIEQIFNIFEKIYSDTSPKNFDSVTQSIRRTVDSFKNDKPIYKIAKLIDKLFLNNYYTPYDILASMKNNFTFSECRDTFYKCIEKSHTYIFISGNINREKCIDLSKSLFSFLNIKEMTQQSSENVKILEPFVKKYKNKNSDEKNTIFTMIYKICYLKKGMHDWNIYVAFANLLDTITGGLYFNILRTIEQIGYMVSTSLTKIGGNNNNMYGMKFIVQSYKKNSDYIYKRTASFVKTELKKRVETITEEEFADFKNGELSGVTDRFTNILDMNYYISINTFDGSYMYSYREIMENTFKTFTLETFKKMFDEFMVTNPQIYCISIDSNSNIKID